MYPQSIKTAFSVIPKALWTQMHISYTININYDNYINLIILWFLFCLGLGGFGDRFDKYFIWSHSQFNADFHSIHKKIQNIFANTELYMFTDTFANVKKMCA